MFNPLPFWGEDVKNYILRSLRPSLETPSLIPLLTEVKYISRMGHFCLQGARRDWPLLPGWREDFKTRTLALVNRLLSLQREDGRWEWKGDMGDLSDAFSTSEAVEFLLDASSLVESPSIPQEAAQRGAQWLLTGKLPLTSPSAGHPGPPLGAALYIRNWNFVGSILRALVSAGRPFSSYQEALLPLFSAQNERGTWWWYGTDDTGRNTYRISYHELVLTGLSALSPSQLPSFYPSCREHALRLSFSYMLSQQLSRGGLRLVPDSTEPTPLGLWGALSLLQRREDPPSPEILSFSSLLLKYLLTCSPTLSPEYRGVICRNLAEYLRIT